MTNQLIIKLLNYSLLVIENSNRQYVCTDFTQLGYYRQTRPSSKTSLEDNHISRANYILSALKTTFLRVDLPGFDSIYFCSVHAKHLKIILRIPDALKKVVPLEIAATCTWPLAYWKKIKSYHFFFLVSLALYCQINYFTSMCVCLYLLYLKCPIRGATHSWQPSASKLLLARPSVPHTAWL